MFFSETPNFKCSMITPLKTWKDKMTENLTLESDSTWAGNFAGWVAEQVEQAQLTGITTKVPPFSFDKAAFEQALKGIQPTDTPSVAAQNFANAWATAMATSLTLTVAPSDFQGVSSPATLWSLVTTALIDPDSILAGQNEIKKLAGAATTDTTGFSEIPEIFRAAFLALTGTVTGVNSVQPAPAPLVAAKVAFQ